MTPLHSPRATQPSAQVGATCDCRASSARQFSFCSGLDDAAWLRLDAHISQRELEEQEPLIEEGAPGGDLFIVTNGLLAVFKALLDGRRQIVGFRYPGDLVSPAGRMQPGA